MFLTNGKVNVLVDGKAIAVSAGGMLIALMVATVRAQVALSLFTDFEGFRPFKPGPQRESEVHTMLDQVIAWGRALKTVREPQTTQSEVMQTI
jgi:hypothetical protein